MKGASVFLAAILAVSAFPNDLQCPEDQLENWEKEQLLIHPNCEKFYMCTFGEAVELDCPAGLFFNLDLWQCDWKQNVDCGERINPDEVEECESESSEEVTTTAPESSEEVTTAAPESSEEVTTAAPESSEEVTTAAPESSEEVTTAAPESSEEVTTAAPESSEEVTTAAPESSEEVTTAAPESSEEVTTAAPESSEELTTPAPECSQEEDNGNSDSLANGCPVDPNVHRLLPHENNCNLFYYCVWGEKVLRECPATLFFNPTIQVCDWPQDSGCVPQEEAAATRLSFNKHLEVRKLYVI